MIGWKIGSQFFNNKKEPVNVWQDSKTALRPTPAYPAEDIFLVVNWNPGNRLLKIGQYGGDKIINVKIDFPETVVIIPIIKNNKSGENTVAAKQGEWWLRAFCGGDRVVMTGLGKDWSKFEKNQQIWVKEIRNLGPRQCGV